MVLNEKGNKGIAAAVIMGLVVIAGLVGWMMVKKDNDDEVLPTESISITPSVSTDSGMVKKQYKDGDYEAIGDYTSPGGAEQIDVALTLSNGVISDITVTPKATRPTSKIKQADFAEHYKVMVVGKSIDDVVLTKVSGSSLTPKGFNDALGKIKLQAGS